MGHKNQFSQYVCVKLKLAKESIKMIRNVILPAGRSWKHRYGSMTLLDKSAICERRAYMGGAFLGTSTSTALPCPLAQ